MWDRDAALVCAAITNNFGVWLFDNNDTGNAYFCFGALGSMLSMWEAPTEALQGFRFNLKLFNIPILEYQQQEEQMEANAKSRVEESSASLSDVRMSTSPIGRKEEEDTIMAGGV